MNKETKTLLKKNIYNHVANALNKADHNNNAAYYTISTYAACAGYNNDESKALDAAYMRAISDVRDAADAYFDAISDYFLKE